MLDKRLHQHTCCHLLRGHLNACLHFLLDLRLSRCLQAPSRHQNSFYKSFRSKDFMPSQTFVYFYCPFRILMQFYFRFSWRRSARAQGPPGAVRGTDAFLSECIFAGTTQKGFLNGKDSFNEPFGRLFNISLESGACYQNCFINSESCLNEKPKCVTAKCTWAFLSFI